MVLVQNEHDIPPIFSRSDASRPLGSACLACCTVTRRSLVHDLVAQRLDPLGQRLRAGPLRREPHPNPAAGVLGLHRPHPFHTAQDRADPLLAPGA